MEMSDSDEDDCQLYSRTAENFILKRNELNAKRRELEGKIGLDILSDDEVINILEDEDFAKRPLFGESKSPNKCIKDVTSVDDSGSAVIVCNFETSEDDIPLAELSRILRKNKRCKKAPSPTKQKRQKRNSRRRNNRPTQTSTSQVRNRGVIVLDDDTGYPMDTLPSINFSSGYHKKRRTSDELENMCLDSIMNQDSEGDDFIGNDNTVTITIEWNNGKNRTRKEFHLRRYQKFESIFEELAKMENISSSRVLLMYDLKSVNPIDTPSSLNLKFYGALTGSISASEINRNKINLDHENDDINTSTLEGNIQVKLLLQSKQTLLLTVFKYQKMDVLYSKCAEEINCAKSKLKLIFDGEYVEPMELVSDLDIEDGDVLEVHVKD